jgi:uncharacterized protein YndB with AHSA1/START domain
VTDLPTDSPTDLGELTYTRTWDAPRQLVFDCMTMPSHLTHFWGPTGVSTPIENIVVELRPGGRFETIMVNDADGAEYPMKAVYVEVDPPEKIAFSEPGVEGGMTTTITFTELPDGRCQTVTHQTNVPAMYRSPEAQAGMETSFDKMAAYLASL